MNTHRDGGSNRAVRSWRAFSPGEPVGGRCDGNRGVRFRPLLSLGVRGNPESTRGNLDRLGSLIFTRAIRKTKTWADHGNQPT
jgi:hypothetical protein